MAEGDAASAHQGKEGAIAELVQMILFVATMLYLYAFIGCYIFTMKFMRQLAFVFQSTRLFIMLGGIMPVVLHRQVLYIFPDVSEGTFPAMMVSALVIAVIFSLIIGSCLGCLHSKLCLSLSPCALGVCSCCGVPDVRRRCRPRPMHRKRLPPPCDPLSCGDSCSRTSTTCVAGGSSRCLCGCRRAGGSAGSSCAGCHCRSGAMNPGIWRWWNNTPCRDMCDCCNKPRTRRQAKEKPSNCQTCERSCNFCGFLCRRPWKKKPKLFNYGRIKH